jgi:multidrug efflux system outer membrane protein
MPLTASLSKPIKPLGVILALVGVLAGCSLAPVYQAPTPAVPQNLQSAGLAGPKSTPPNQVDPLSKDERELLSSLDSSEQLQRWVEAGLRYNQDLRLAVLRAEQARAQSGIAHADRLPTVAAGLQSDRQHLHDKAADERYGQDIAVASLGVSDFELDFFGRVRSLSEAAQHDYLATQFGALAVRKALIVEVARLYLQERLQADIQTYMRSMVDSQSQLLQVLVNQQIEGQVAQDAVDTQRMAVR